ncbi:MAG: 16S rRNA (guanine(966)-N(2))-methyltransferase RsmD [Ruminococcaceae bacterium]|nr:16S rRNA (guanine(966)-N(2))-methyltransferase RsmD [Oscillospiraceae bacterium]
MRIITGSAKGMTLFSPKGDQVRPTTEMAKEGMFSSIQFDIEGARVLDLFSGSGQLGLEALSRGAAFAVFVDASQDSLNVTRQNVVKTGFTDRSRIIRSEYGEYIKNAGKQNEKFDIVFADPPYGKEIIGEIVKRLLKNGLLNDGAIVLCETDNGEVELEGAEGIESVKKYKYGKTFVYMVRIGS